MQPHAAERRHLERQIAYARPIFMVLALGDLLERPPQDRGPHAVTFVLVYLGVALGLLLLQYAPRLGSGAGRVAGSAGGRSRGACGFPSADALGAGLLVPLPLRGAGGGNSLGNRALDPAGGRGHAGGVAARPRFRADLAGRRCFPGSRWRSGTFTAGVGLAFLGDRNRRHAAEHEFLARLTGMLKVEQGVAESLRLMLDELARGFDCEKAILVFRDAEARTHLCLDGGRRPNGTHRPRRIFRWRAATLSCSTSRKPPFAGTRWMERPVGLRMEPPRRPQTCGIAAHAGRGAAGAAACIRMLSVTFDFAGQPVGRILLGNGQRRFLPQDLQWFERVVRHLAPPLENLFLLRHLRTRAIEGERSRISRDIHDGILQTLLSVDIQLDVLRRKLPQAPEQVAARSGDAAADRAQRDRRSCAAWSPTCVRSACKAPIWWT